MAISNMNPWRHVARREHMSRVERRRDRRSNCVLKRQLISVMFICSCSSAAAMEQDAMLQRIISLTEAATRAALSAEQTLNQVQGMTSSATSSSEGLQAASRILKAPDTFNGDDPMQFASWRFQFTSWLTFGDSRYTTLLEKVEAMTSSPSIGSYDTAEKELAHKLYAVLTSYLRGRCSHIIKAFAKSRDGFAIWYQLMREFEPTSRQRSLALAQALASYPVFAKDKSCLESILVYEQTVQQFEESSSTTYPDELKVATLMRCCNNKLREFLQLNIKDSSTYVEVREHIMNYERVSKSWTQEQVLKAIQQDPARPDLGGPTPMEIDRVEVKGKGKSKSKSKGKNNSGYGWSSGAWGFGRGRGRGRDGKGKGKKGRGKGKGKNKGKSKNKGKGPHKGKVGQDQCAICYGYGHWSRDCPHKPRPMEVNQVQEQPQQQQWTGYLATPSHGPHQGQGSQHPGLPVQQLPVVSGATTASSSSFRPPSTSTGSTVRRIFHIGPPTPSSSPSSSMYRDGSVRMVQFEEIPEEEYIHVTTTQDVGEEEWVILDSGSDVSLLPDRFLADIGSDRSHALRDCQGGELAVMGTRFTDLQVQDVSGESVVLRHQFVVGDVTTSLISLGQLYQLGWRIEEDGNGQLCLKDPSKNVEIPVHYRGKSFALKAHVRHVSEEVEQNVRAVVRVFDKVSNHEFFAWGSIKIGMPFLKTVGWGYADPRPAWGSRLPYRTTLIKKRSSEEPKWTVAELSQKYMEKPVPFGDIAEISNLLGEQMAEILTTVTAEPHGLEDIGEIVEGEVNIPDVAQGELHPELPPGLQEEEGMDLEAAGPPTAPEAVAVPVEEVLQDEITLYDGFTLTRNSKAADLRVGCQWIGVSQSGSKQKMFERIARSHAQALKRAELEVALQQYQSDTAHAEVVPIPKQPTARERALHETTHLPYRAWCPHCVATRSYGDHHETTTDPQKAAEREHPVIQADFFHCEERGPGEDNNSKYVLLMVDTWTRYVHAEPLKVRNKKSVGEALARFIGSLGHVGTVEIAVDNENVLVAGMEFCRNTRLMMGMQTITTTNKHYDKGRTSVAERMVQSIRNLQKTLVLQLEEAAQFRLPGGHALRYWAVMHSAWLYCRFHVHTALKVTPFQAVTGRPYRGRLANFGQIVLGLDPKAGKYKPLWKRGVYLGKDGAGHDVLGIGENEVVRTKALRRTANLWSAEDALLLKIGPWDTTGYTYSHAKTPALPPILPQLVDKDAADVAAYKGGSSEEEELQPEQPEQDVPGGVQEPVEGVQEQEVPVAAMEMSTTTSGTTTSGPSNVPFSALALLQPSLPVSHTGRASGSEAMDAGSSKRPGVPEVPERPKVPRVDEPPVPEPKVKAAKTEVRMVCNVEATITEEMGLEEQWEVCPTEFEMDNMELNKGEGEGPPKVTDEQLGQLDSDAALDEIRKLHDLKVIVPVSPDPSMIRSECLVDTTLVYDWRFREGQWRRRCRIVAREYRDGQTTEDQYGPTSTFAAVRVLFVLSMLFDLSVTAMDVKDAFLLVDQKEEMYVLIPAWIREIAQDGATHWLLKKCLPGQRNAALRWYEHFSNLCIDAGMEPYLGCPTIMKPSNQVRKVFLSVHVDDILFIGKPEDVTWFANTAGSSLTMKVDGPHEQGSGKMLHYLKKKITLFPEGVLIQPNNTYIPKLISLLKISGRRGRGLPYHSTLEAYNAELENENERLEGEQAATFRSALGLILYISQDRPDIQFSTKTLATYMSRPCVKAMAAVKHLALYLASNEEGGILLRRCEPYDAVFDRWNESELVEPDYRQDRSTITLDIFSDSSWGDEKSTRKSTTSGMIFMNGCLIHSICRSQATIALSSCEAELYAANTTMVESIYLYQLIQFLMSDETAVKQRLFVDSTSAKFVVQRSGVGRLKHVSIKHMFLQQLLRQKVFSIHKVPTRINPADLNTKKLSLDRRNLLSSLCGLFPHVSPEREGDEVLFSRRVHRQVTARLVQALQGLSVTLLQGCTSPVSGEELQQGQALRGGRALQAPVQGSGNGDGYSYGWYVFYKEYKIYVLVFVLVISMVVATTCTMYPGRRLGPRRGEDRRGEGEASSSSRPTGGDGSRGGEDTIRRSRTTSRERRSETEEAITALHRRVALMFVTVVEGRFVARRPVTEQGIRSTLQHLVAASMTLDAGAYLTLQQAFSFLDTPNEERARRLLNDLLYTVERDRGRLPHESAELSRMLLRRYSEVIRAAGYPLLRIEEMVYGPTLGPETPSRDSEYSSYTVEEPFNENASRSRDDTVGYSGEEGEEDGLCGAEGEEAQRGEGGEEESMVGPTPEGESLSEVGEGRYNVFETNSNEPEREPHSRSIVGMLRTGRTPASYPSLTTDELNGERYPGAGVNLDIYSDKERMCRMLECLEARLAGCEVRGDREGYDSLRRERDDLMDLISVANDIRPGETTS